MTMSWQLAKLLFPKTFRTFRLRTILLLRHAKSAWDNGRLSDHERPLSRRGEKAARAIADLLVGDDMHVDLIICSTATRTRQTLGALVERLPPPAPPISLENGLYLASGEALLDRLRSLPDDACSVLLIGHNDGIWHLAEALAGHGEAPALASLRAKFPTGALASLRAPAERWTDLALGSAELIAFIRPRELPGTAA
jgi:phosphohistidine phosphatase